MSEEVYIKAPCCECNGRVSLPLDAVGMDFNCPHCGAGLQMLLKHVCEHCNGKLSFDNSPEAIGAEVECGHCNKLTTLSPSTFSTDSAEEESVPKPEDFSFFIFLGRRICEIVVFNLSRAMGPLRQATGPAWSSAGMGSGMLSGAGEPLTRKKKRYRIVISCF